VNDSAADKAVSGVTSPDQLSYAQDFPMSIPCVGLEIKPSRRRPRPVATALQHHLAFATRNVRHIAQQRSTARSSSANARHYWDRHGILADPISGAAVLEYGATEILPPVGAIL
jgi:hypothetical protein